MSGIGYDGLRIAFCGPGGSGKSTLAAEVSRLSGLPLISEAFRTAVRAAGVSIREMSRDERIAAQALGMGYQIWQESMYEAAGYIADRSVFDNLIYAGLTVEDSGGLHGLLERMIDRHRRGHGRMYDALIFVPRYDDGPPEDDGERFLDREDLEAQVAQRLMAVSTHAVGVGSVASRAEQALRILDESAYNFRSMRR